MIERTYIEQLKKRIEERVIMECVYLLKNFIRKKFC